MPRQSNAYTFVFALIVCVVCSAALSLVSEGLRPQRELNIEMDIKKNILKAVDLITPLDKKASAKDVLKVYDNKIEEIVINGEGGIVEGKTPGEIREGEALYPVYIYKEEGKIVSYCFPIVGKGLWSTIYGYFALEQNAKTVRGVTFYRHGETPGLGAEIEKDWFQKNFKGKSIWDESANVLFPVSIVKGKVSDVVADEVAIHYVDGISGATMTSRGVSKFMDEDIKRYEAYFSKIRQ